MKKGWKMSVLTGFFCCVAVLLLKIDTHAAVYSGHVDGYRKGSYDWTVDTQTGVLTIDGSDADLPSIGIPWEPYEEYITHLELKGTGSFTTGYGSEYDGFDRIVQTASCSWGDGFSWKLDREAGTLVYEGEGELQTPWNIGHLLTYVDTVVLGDSITEVIPRQICSWDSKDNCTLVVGKSVHFASQLNGIQPLYAKEFVVDPENPYYTSYEGGLYNKDCSSLLRSPYAEDMKFHPNLRYLEAYSLHLHDGKVVLPWGLLTLNSEATWDLHNMTVVFPDTLTYVHLDNSWIPELRTSHVYIYSKNNQVAAQRLVNFKGDYGRVTAQVVDSVAEYYPDVITTGWQQSGGKTYYYSNGQKLTGWQVISPAWYYFDPDGSLVKNRWVKSGGKWYFLRNSNGMMSTNEWIDWYHVRYRTGPSGVMYANTWASIGGKWYYFQSSGAMAVNQWVRGKDGKWYYLKGDGVMAANQWIYGKDKKWYYVGNDGVMLTNAWTPDGYYVNANGVWVK